MDVTLLGVTSPHREEQFTLSQMAGTPTKRRWLIPVLIAVALAIGGGVAAWYVFGGQAAGPPARVKDGIAAPHPRCIDDVADFGHPWITDGWWAGRVDGQAREMTSQAAMATSMAGKRVEGVWLCPPKSQW